jgi:hypothetical protein
MKYSPELQNVKEKPAKCTAMAVQASTLITMISFLKAAHCVWDHPNKPT